MSLDDFRCDRCGADISACGMSPGDGHVYCSQVCADRGPAAPEPEQQALL